MASTEQRRQDAGSLMGARTDPSGTRRGSHRDLGPIALIVVVALGVYANSINNGFLHDDHAIVLGDRRTRDPAAWRDIFRYGYCHGRNFDAIYRPIPLLTYLANHTITGFSPAGYRVVNLALHAGVSLMVYAIALRLFRRRWTAITAGLLFAVHPIHGEVVVMIVGRADILCSLLYLLGIWQLLREPLSSPSRLSRRFLSVLILLALAMLTKELAITFIGAAVLADVCRRRASDGPSVRPWRPFLLDRLVWRYLPVLLVCSMLLWLRYYLLGRQTWPGAIIGWGIHNPLESADLVGRLLTPFVLLGKYLNLLAWPHPLCYDYSYNAVPVATALSDGRVLIGLSWAVLLVVVAVASWRGRRRLLWSVGFFVVTYSVVSNSVVLLGTLFAERLLYLSSVGWCWAVALVLTALYDRCAAMATYGRVVRGVVGVAIAAAMVAYGAKTIVRNRDVLLNNATLAADGVRVNPRSARCQSSAARLFIQRRDHKTAIKHLKAALEIDDTVAGNHMLIAQEYVLDNQVERGIAHMRRACELSRPQDQFIPAFLLAQFYLQARRPAEAIEWFRKANRINPSHAPCAASLAYALASADPPQRDLRRAADYVEQALTAEPNDPIALNAAYVVYRACKQPQRAAQIVRRALRVVPRTHPAYGVWQVRRRQITSRPGAPVG